MLQAHHVWSPYTSRWAGGPGLKTESLSPTTQNSYCTVSRGKWFSFYNGRYYFNAYGGTLQIDHVVPVENAWVSGA